SLACISTIAILILAGIFYAHCAGGQRVCVLRFLDSLAAYWVTARARGPSAPSCGGLNWMLARLTRSMAVVVALRTVRRFPLCAGGRCISSTSNRAGCVVRARHARGAGLPCAERCA